MIRPGMSGVFRRLRREELGATSVVVVLLMTVLLVSAALVVDVGAIQARRAQLQDAADAAALAIAQECFEHPASSALGCATAVVTASTSTALDLAVANVADGEVTAVTPVFTGDTVRVTLASRQQGYFGVFAGRDEKDLTASATARWEQPTVPLSLAFRACAFPDPGEPALLQASLAVNPLLGGVLDLSGDCGLLGGEDLGDVLSSGLGNTLGLVSGGWLTTSTPILGLTPDDCSYDPNLLTTVSATVSKVIPSRCADVIQAWGVSAASPQRVILPVFDDGTEQLIVDDVFGVGDVDRYAVVDLTAYAFTGLLGIGNVAGSSASLCTSAGGALGGILEAIPAFLRSLLLGVTGCQALQGTFVGFVESDEAAQLLVGVTLVE
jgi:Flp pilus assembly protein TadG